MQVYEVLDQLLFIGGQTAGLTLEEKLPSLQKLNVHTIIQATRKDDLDLPFYFPQYIKVRLLDTRPLPEDMSELWGVAQQAARQVLEKKPVFIFCSAAKNRAPFMAALTLICRGWTPRQALAQLREKRPGCLQFQPFVDYLEVLE